MAETKTTNKHFSDRLANLIHTWTFLALNLFGIFTWMLINIRVPMWSFDQPPFELLKLSLTIELFVVGIILVMNHYRRLEIDRKAVYNDIILNYQMREQLKLLFKKIEKVIDKVEAK